MEYFTNRESSLLRSPGGGTLGSGPTEGSRGRGWGEVSWVTTVWRAKVVLPPLGPPTPPGSACVSRSKAVEFPMLVRRRARLPSPPSTVHRGRVTLASNTGRRRLGGRAAGKPRSQPLSDHHPRLRRRQGRRRRRRGKGSGGGAWGKG